VYSSSLGAALDFVLPIRAGLLLLLIFTYVAQDRITQISSTNIERWHDREIQMLTTVIRVNRTIFLFACA
jgi:hypothetical protein